LLRKAGRVEGSQSHIAYRDSISYVDMRFTDLNSGEPDIIRNWAIHWLSQARLGGISARLKYRWM